MSSLRDRMNRLRGVKPAEEQEASPDRSEQEAAAECLAAAHRCEEGDAGPGWAELGVRLHVNEFGECLERRLRLPLTHRSGHHRLQEWTDACARLAAFHPEAGRRRCRATCCSSTSRRPGSAAGPATCRS